MSQFTSEAEQSPSRTVDQSPSRAVVETVAATEGVDETDLPPLFSVIDPDALDALFDTRGDCSVEGQITFTYHGRQVRVGADGDVTLPDA